MTISDIKQHILGITQKVIEKVLGKQIGNLSVIYPPDVKFGDFSIEFFSVVKEEVRSLLGGISKEEMGKEEKESYRKAMAKGIQDAIAKIARSVAEISADDVIEKVSVVGPYVNFKVRNAAYFKSIFSEVIEKGNSFGNSSLGSGQKVMVEYLSPNTNKPLHLGHLRNGSTGMSISNILAFCGYNVVKSNLVNDRGVHICKSMLAWQRWGNGETPQSAGLKGDHFVGKWYVRYSQEEDNDPLLAEEVQAMLKRWEEGNPETMALWEKMNGWVYDGFTETYRSFGLKFDTFYYESQTYMLGKDIIEEGLAKGVFKRDEKNIVTFFLPEEFGKDKDGNDKRVTVLRSDGTSVYITQDLGTALKKVEDHKLDRSIYVVGSEQIHHFKCLFTILKALGYKWAENCYHLSYGMVYLPEGKMKSREGKVVDADNLIRDVVEIVSGEIKKRNPDISADELEKRAHVIAVGAIKFHLLRVTPGQDIHFDPKESVALDGFTASYCQYAYVRAAAILRAVEESIDEIGEIDFSVLGEREEIILAQKIMQFPEAVEYAVKELNPSRIASHVFEIAQAFSQFYNKHSVLKVESGLTKKARLALVKATSVAISNGLHLLGIETVEEM
ncbi:MAG: arginine--tRNA ligase [Parcubacteria group bacterium]|jgi:arginyl-tRNA synthetase